MALFGRPKMKVLRIDEIEKDLEFYPRERTSWIVAYKYSEAMKTGQKFPPITVAEINGRFVLVDGWHRIEALKTLKQEHVQAEILNGLSPAEIFVEAVRRNTSHGQPLTTTEVTSVIIRLQDLKIPLKEISSIIHMPLEKIKPFVNKRVTHAITGQPVALKKPLYHLAGVSNKIKDEYQIDEISGISQTKILDEVIAFLENSWIEIKDDDVREKLETIYLLIKDRLYKRKKRTTKKKKTRRRRR